MSEQSRPKRWWRAVWRGLVVDRDAKHYRAMGSALWLFLYLVIHADRERGTLGRKYKTIAEDMGVRTRTIRAWMSKLRRHDYVSVTSSGRALFIHIHKWKTFSAPPDVTRPRPLSDTTRAR